MRYHTTEPELVYTSNRGRSMSISFSYPEKNKPMDMAQLYYTFSHLGLIPHHICEAYINHYERENKIERVVRKRLSKIIPDWKSDYEN